MSHTPCGCPDTSNPCQDPTPCGCPVKDLSTDCIIYTGDDLSCTGVTKNTILTTALQQIDTFICSIQNNIANTFQLLNVGGGANIYKGVNGIGQKLIRSITKSGSLVTITQNTDDIQISVDEEILSEFITDLLPPSDAIFLESGNTTELVGAGTELDPYKYEIVNLQKTISGSTYTLLPEDDNYTLIVNNGSTPITIFVPLGLGESFNVGFIQRGTADVTFQASIGSGLTINTPITGAYKIRGQYYNAHIEKYGLFTEFFLLGNLKI